MKRKELKENEPLKISNGYAYAKYFDDQQYCDRRYYMTVFTDGVIASEGKPLLASESDVEAVEKKYNCILSTIEKKDLQLKDYTYAITYTIVKKWSHVGHVYGWFDFCVGMDVYMKNPKDRQTIRTVRRVLRDIEANNHSVDYSSVWAATFGRRRGLLDFEPKEIGDNVIQLTRI